MCNTERAVVYLVLQAILLGVSIAGAFLSHGPNNPAYLELFFVLPFLLGSIGSAVAVLRNTKLKLRVNAPEFGQLVIILASIPMLLCAIVFLCLTLVIDIWISA